MIKFLKAAFQITFFQLFIIALFTLSKYLVNTYQLTSKIQKPFLWTCLILAIILILTLSINGLIENNTAFLKKWTEKLSNKQIEIIKKFLHIGLILPIAIFYATFVYMMTPTSTLTFLALFLGIVFRNIINYLKEEKTVTVSEINNGT